MDLTLFVVLLCLSLVLIALGLFKTEHSELSLIGFVFLFLLSISIISSDITYKVGFDVNTSINSSSSYDNLTNSTTTTTFSQETNRAVYEPLNLSDSFSHRLGYWLAIASFLGFIGVIMGFRKSEGFR